MTYVPTGKLETHEVFNKMSLYLLAQLMYGVTLVLNEKAKYLIKDLETLYKSIGRYPADAAIEPKKPRKSEKGKKRMIDEAAHNQGMEAEADESDEEQRSRKKRPTTRNTKLSLLNLSDPRAYVDHQIPSREHPTHQMDEGSQLDEMFMDQTQTMLPPLELPPADKETPQAKISLASLFGDEKVSMSSLIFDEGVQLDQALALEMSHLTADLSVEEIRPEPELPFERAQPIYRQKGEPILETTRETYDGIQLEPLPEVVRIPAPKGHRRKRHLIYDEQTQLTDEHILNNMMNVDDIVRSLDDIRMERMRHHLTPLKDLFDPIPRHIPGFSEELYPLFEIAKKDYRERPLTFKELQRMNSEDYEVRRLDVDVETLCLDSPLVTLEETMQPAAGESLLHETTLQLEAEREKISMADLVEREKISMAELDLEQDHSISRQSSLLEAEKGRRETMQRATAGSLEQPEQLLDEEFVIQPLDLTEQSRDRDIELQRESIFDKQSPELQEDEDWIDAEMSVLYSEVVGSRSIAYFHDLAKVNQLTKANAARKFFTLLKLLKHRKVTVEQHEPYGKISINALGSPRE